MRPTMRNQVHNIHKTSGREEGFAIPIAMGMGLVMLVLAMTAIVRSQSDSRVALDRKFSAQARTAAEIGVTRVQDFLNRYRAAAAAPACSADAKWPTSGYGACTDTTVMSWGFPDNIPNLCPGDRTAVDGFATNDWQSAGTVGDYRLVNYTGSAGVLTVEGRVNGGETNEARSRLQVTLPVTSPTGVPVASLWVTGSITGSPQINSEVVANSCTTGGGNFYLPTSTQILTSIKTSQSMPIAPNTPSSGVTTLTSISGKTLPQTGDTVDTTTFPGTNLYKYVVNSLDGSFSVTPSITTTTSGVPTTTPVKVWLWVKGNIDLSGNPITSKPSTVIVNQCGSSASCGPFDVRIYRDTSTTASSPTLTLDKGTAVCDVFFHLPDFAVTFDSTKGTTSSQDCGDGTKNTGVYWVKSWSGAGAVTRPTVIDPPRATWGTAITAVNQTSFTMPPIAPQIGPVKQWTTQSNNLF
jgi:hypothetical protein